MRGICLGFAMVLPMITVYAKWPTDDHIWVLWKILPFVLDFPIDQKLLTYPPAQKEKKENILSDRILTDEIGTNDIITYDAKDTKRYRQSIDGHVIFDVIVTKWPPSQWHRNKIQPYPLIYIQKMDTGTYQALEKEVIGKFPQQTIEFMIKNDGRHNSLKGAGFKSYGIFLSKEIAQGFVAPESHR